MRPHTRRRALLAAALLAATSGLVAHQMAGALSGATLGVGGAFQGGDGDLVGNTDWDDLTLCTAPNTPAGCNVNRGTDPTGQTDNSYTQGSKEDDVNVVVEAGSIPNSKADIGQFAVGTFVPTSGARAGHTIMALAWIRNNDSGTTNFDYEINQKAQPYTGSPGPVVLNRHGDGNGPAIDDILIGYDLSGGAQKPTLTIRKWVSTNNALDSQPGVWGPPMTLNDTDSEGATNCTPPGSKNSCPTGVGALLAANTTFFNQNIAASRFGEAAIDLTAFGIIPNQNDPNAPCVSFAGALIKSRASDSFTAQMKDFAGPIPVGIDTCASITIDKVTIPSGDSQLFTFNPSANLPGGSFQLADATTPKNYGSLIPGNYSVSEVVPAGWDLTGATCTSNQAGNSTNPASITLRANEDVVCTFTNTKRGRVIIDKVTQPDPDPTGTIFDFTGSFGPFTLTNAQTPFNSGLIVPGSYNVAESAEPGWTPVGASCDDGSAVNNIQVGPGETVTCTFTNQGYGRIIVHKETEPDGSPVAFSYASTYGSPFQLHDGEQNDTGTTVPPGQYTVTETVPAGWVLSDITCVDANGSTDKATGTASINLDPGETVDCYYTNTQNAQIIVEKHVVGPNPDDQSFPFSASYSLTGFQLKDGESNPSGDLAPNHEYAVAESLLANWKLVNQNTTDGFSGSVLCSNQEDSLHINLQPGQTVVCSFVNERQVGAIEIVKTAKNKAAGGSVGVAGVNLTIHDVANNVDIPVVTGADGKVCVNYFGFGDYTVKEVSAPAGYSIDPNTYNVTINSVSYCDDGYGTPHHVVNVVDQPLTNVSIVVDSQVDGATETVIDCGAAGSKTVSDGSLDISDLVPTAPAATLTCTITVDP